MLIYGQVNETPTLSYMVFIVVDTTSFVNNVAFVFFHCYLSVSVNCNKVIALVRLFYGSKIHERVCTRLL